MQNADGDTWHAGVANAGSFAATGSPQLLAR
jgi:hypothetical protein